MPELRKDPIINRWVIVARERAKRPITSPAPARKTSLGFCPLCPGNEEKTPEIIYTDYLTESGIEKDEWQLRVVGNKFPALVQDGTMEPQSDGLYDRMDGIGAHEVVVESRDHERSFADFDEWQTFRVLKAYRDRIHTLGQDPRFRYILVFKNHGSEAGASLEHPHSQIIALPIVPKRVLEELQGADAYYEKNRCCIFCRIIQNERNDRSRLVLENSEFVAIEPYAPRFPYETWVLPKQHETHYDSMGDDRMKLLAELFRTLMNRMKTVLNDPPYNFMLHTSPSNEPGKQIDFHWHLEITPKLTRVAGFEWGTGFFINPMPPEIAAEILRGDLVGDLQNGLDQ